MNQSEKRIEEFKIKFPSIKYVHRVCVSTRTFKADDNVISLADVDKFAIDKKILVEKIKKGISISEIKIIESKTSRQIYRTAHHQGKIKAYNEIINYLLKNIGDE